LGLSEEQMVHAQGVAGSSASGLREAYLSGGSWTKMYHPGWAAHGAIMAALFAQQGFTGTSTVFEGRFGLFKSHLHPEDGDYEALLGGLGERWEIRNIGFKPYPCGVINHAYIDSAFILMDQHSFSSEDIDRIICYIHPDAAQTICEPIASKLRPESGYHAKFSLQFSVAAALVDRNITIDTYSDAKAKDQKILEMTDRVEYRLDQESVYPKTYPSWLEIQLKDGRTLVDKQPYNKGSLENPMTDQDLQKKYLNNALIKIDQAKAKRIQEFIMNLEHQDSIHQLSSSF
jgi:2-methylcitrate dehydratase PrpD